MSSSINTNNIDGNYPTLGQDNDSQGFRDNFTNIKTNFSNAKEEIEDLQSKVVLKSALTGEVLLNDGAGAVLSNFELRDMTETRVSHGTTSGTVTLVYTEGSYQAMTANGNVSLAFSGLPVTGKLSKIRFELTIQDVAHTLTLPASVTIGADTLQQIDVDTKEITFDSTGTYVFEFTSDDAGTTITVQDLTRNRSSAAIRTPANTGRSGDHAGMMVVDADYVYVCTGTYDGVSVIWKRATLVAY